METISNFAVVVAATVASVGGALGVAWLCLKVVIRSMSRHAGAIDEPGR